MEHEEDFSGEECNAVPYEDKPDMPAPQTNEDGTQDEEDVDA